MKLINYITSVYLKLKRWVTVVTGLGIRNSEINSCSDTNKHGVVGVTLEFNYSATLLSFQLLGLLPVRSFNVCYVHLNMFVSVIVYITTRKPPSAGVVNKDIFCL